MFCLFARSRVWFCKPMFILFFFTRSSLSSIFIWMISSCLAAQICTMNREREQTKSAEYSRDWIQIMDMKFCSPMIRCWVVICCILAVDSWAAGFGGVGSPCKSVASESPTAFGINLMAAIEPLFMFMNEKLGSDSRSMADVMLDEGCLLDGCETTKIWQP